MSDLTQDDVDRILDQKEIVKYKHLREYLIQTNTPGAFDASDAYCEGIIRAVLADLPQVYMLQRNPGEMGGIRNEIHDSGIYYQRIGSITEKTTYEREGFV